MFLLIPAIIVFLLLAYVYLNEMSIYGQILVYGFCLFIIAATVYLYKGIKKDMHQQEINKIENEILTLKKRVQNTTSQENKQAFEQKIKFLEIERSKLENK
jgi:predicted ATPase